MLAETGNAPVAYMLSNKLPQKAMSAIIANQNMCFADESQWNEFLEAQSIEKPPHVQITTGGALIGIIMEHGLSDNLVIVSDDAGQFNVLMHALCWIHTNRIIDKVIPFSDSAEKDLNLHSCLFLDPSSALCQKSHTDNTVTTDSVAKFNIAKAIDVLGSISANIKDGN